MISESVIHMHQNSEVAVRTGICGGDHAGALGVAGAACPATGSILPRLYHGADALSKLAGDGEQRGRGQAGRRAASPPPTAALPPTWRTKVEASSTSSHPAPQQQLFGPLVPMTTRSSAAALKQSRSTSICCGTTGVR
jgi:hypothetical protein